MLTRMTNEVLEYIKGREIECMGQVGMLNTMRMKRLPNNISLVDVSGFRALEEFETGQLHFIECKHTGMISMTVANDR